VLFCVVKEDVRIRIPFPCQVVSTLYTLRANINYKKNYNFIELFGDGRKFLKIGEEY